MWTEPQIAVAGEIIEAAEWNGQLRENLLMLEPALVAAKGDLVSGAGDHEVVVVPVGADGEVLLTDPSTASGLRWGRPGAPAAVGQAKALTSDPTTLTSFVQPTGAALTLNSGGGDLLVIAPIRVTALHYGTSTAADATPTVGIALDGGTPVAAKEIGKTQHTVAKVGSDVKPQDDGFDVLVHKFSASAGSHTVSLMHKKDAGTPSNAVGLLDGGLFVIECG